MSSQASKKPLLFHVIKSFEVFFLEHPAASGILLLISLSLALLFANTPLQHYYEEIRHLPTHFSIGSFHLNKSLEIWVSEGLMSIFFLLAGLEIKREIVSGELSSLKTAFIPIVCAVSGMFFPAIIYIYFNHDLPSSNAGWAIPMATDIAFALGILSLLKDYIPRSLVVIFAATVIIDDLVAVIVIALFYNHSLNTTYLIAAGIIYGLLFVLNRLNIQRIIYYFILGALLWYCLLQSGIHATVAGVLLAFMIPTKGKLNRNDYTQKLNKLIHQHTTELSDPEYSSSEKRLAIIHDIHALGHKYESPLHRLEHALQPLVNFFIIPIFILFNAGTAIYLSNISAALYNEAFWGVFLGLFVGKFIGLSLLPGILAHLKVFKLPKNLKPADFIPLGLLGGMGFTMSIFIADLAFPNSTALLDDVKIAILFSSLLCGILGYLALLYRFKIKPRTSTQTNTHNKR